MAKVMRLRGLTGKGESGGFLKIKIMLVKGFIAELMIAARSPYP